MVALRWAGIVVTVAAAALLAWTVLGLERLVGAGEVQRRWGRLALSVAVGATGLITLVQYPLSPSYNSLALQALCVVGAGLALALFTDGRRALVGWALIGAGGMLTFLAKPTTAIGAALLVALAVIAVLVRHLVRHLVRRGSRTGRVGGRHAVAAPAIGVLVLLAPAAATTALSPYRYASLARADAPTVISDTGGTVGLTPADARATHELLDLGRQLGITERTGIIDLTRESPGYIYQLGARALGRSGRLGCSAAIPAARLPPG